MTSQFCRSVFSWLKGVTCTLWAVEVQLFGSRSDAIARRCSHFLTGATDYLHQLLLSHGEGRVEIRPHCLLTVAHRRRRDEICRHLEPVVVELNLLRRAFVRPHSVCRAMRLFISVQCQTG